jgi:hypothetical protein
MKKRLKLPATAGTLAVRMAPPPESESTSYFGWVSSRRWAHEDDLAVRVELRPETMERPVSLELYNPKGVWTIGDLTLKDARKLSRLLLKAARFVKDGTFPSRG